MEWQPDKCGGAERGGLALPQSSSVASLSDGALHLPARCSPKALVLSVFFGCTPPLDSPPPVVQADPPNYCECSYKVYSAAGIIQEECAARHYVSDYRIPPLARHPHGVRAQNFPDLLLELTFAYPLTLF
jgi:hypothetical protein